MTMWRMRNKYNTQTWKCYPQSSEKVKVIEKELGVVSVQFPRRVILGVSRSDG